MIKYFSLFFLVGLALSVEAQEGFTFVDIPSSKKI